MSHINDSLTSATAGMTPARSKFKSVTYTHATVNQQELFDAYRGSWEAERFIDKRIGDSTRKWREWQAKADQITKLEATELRLHLKSKIKKARTLADVGGQAYLYIDTNDDIDRMEPIAIEAMKVDAIRFVTVLNYGQLIEGEYDDDPMSDKYGMPKFYTVSSTEQGQVHIHPSRVVVFYGKEKVTQSTIEVRGESLLVAALDAVKQYGSTMANVADLVFEAKIDIIKVKGLMDQVKTQAGADIAAARYNLFALMKATNGMGVIDMENEDYSQKTMSFATLPDIIKATEHQMSAAGGYPHAIFMGASSGGLGSTGTLELSAYYDTVLEYQENKIAAPCELLDELIIVDALGSRPPEVHYNWRPLWQVSDSEKADNGLKHSQTIKNLQELFPDEVIAPAAINLLTEAGTMNGIEAAYLEWVAGGGVIGDEDDETGSLGGEGE